MDSIPVNVLLTEETVVLVHDVPQCLEVSACIVVVLLLIDARSEEQEATCEERDARCDYILFHNFPLSSLHFVTLNFLTNPTTKRWE